MKHGTSDGGGYRSLTRFTEEGSVSVSFQVCHASIGLALRCIGDLGLEAAACVVAWVVRDSGLSGYIEHD